MSFRVKFEALLLPVVMSSKTALVILSDVSLFSSEDKSFDNTLVDDRGMVFADIFADDNGESSVFIKSEENLFPKFL